MRTRSDTEASLGVINLNKDIGKETLFKSQPNLYSSRYLQVHNNTARPTRDAPAYPTYDTKSLPNSESNGSFVSAVSELSHDSESTPTPSNVGDSLETLRESITDLMSGHNVNSCSCTDVKKCLYVNTQINNRPNTPTIARTSLAETQIQDIVQLLKHQVGEAKHQHMKPDNVIGQQARQVGDVLIHQERQMKELQLENKHNRALIVQLQHRLDNRDKQIKQKNECIAHLDNKIKQYRMETGQAMQVQTEKMREMEKLRVLVDALREELMAKTSKVQKVGEELMHVTKQKNELAKERSEIDKVRAELQRQVEELSKMSEKTNKRAKRLEKTLKERDEEIKMMKTNNEKLTKELTIAREYSEGKEAQIKQALSQNTGLQMKLEDLAAALTRKNEIISAHEQSVERLTARIELLEQTQTSSMNELRSSLENRETMLDNLKLELNAREKTILEKARGIRELRMKLDQRDREDGERLRRLEKETTRLKEENIALKDHLWKMTSERMPSGRSECR